MKLVTFLIPPQRLEALKRVLWERGVRTATLSPAEGLNFQRGAGEEDFVVVPVQRLKVEVALRDGEVEGLLEAALEALRTGRVGDGKVFVGPLDQAARVRTGERGEAAL